MAQTVDGYLAALDNPMEEVVVALREHRVTFNI